MPGLLYDGMVVSTAVVIVLSDRTQRNNNWINIVLDVSFCQFIGSNGRAHARATYSKTEKLSSDNMKAVVGSFYVAFVIAYTFVLMR